MKICEKYMVSKTIRSTFRKCSIWPFNPTVFSPSDFTPAQSSSFCYSDPPTYPPHQASSLLSAQLSDLDDMDWADSSDCSDDEQVLKLESGSSHNETEVEEVNILSVSPVFKFH